METIFVITANRFFRESLIRLFRSDKGFRVMGAADCSPLLCVQGALMIGMDDDQEMFLKSVQAGAEGYLLRDASAKQILAAVRRLEQSAVVCPKHLERALFNFIADGPGLNATRPQSTRELTPREHQLTSLVAQGLANKEIAGRLNLSLQTVKNHVHSILQKTQSKNRAVLAQFLESRLAANGQAGKLPARLSAPF
jgi:DNA-binding NarL/FixJ family response regulator